MTVKEFDFWQDHSLNFLEMAFRHDRRERLQNPDGYGKRTGECDDTVEMFLGIKNGHIQTVSFDTDGSDGLYDKTDMYIWKNINWDSNDSLEHSDFDSDYNVAEPPRFIVQHVASIAGDENSLNLGNYGQNTGACDREIFLVTARATGGSGGAPVLLQTTYSLCI